MLSVLFEHSKFGKMNQEGAKRVPAIKTLTLFSRHSKEQTGFSSNFKIVNITIFFSFARRRKTEFPKFKRSNQGHKTQIL
jgi:hypothetical protein